MIRRYKKCDNVWRQPERFGDEVRGECRRERRGEVGMTSRYQDVNCDHAVADAQNVAIDVVGGLMIVVPWCVG